MVAAFLVQPYAHLAFAAGIATTPGSQTIQSTETKYSDVSANGFETLKASFHYVAEKLEVGDNLNYGWKTATGQGQLGTIAGIAETTSDPSTTTDETGDVNNVALPAMLDNRNFQLYFANTGTTSGVNDQVDISNINVSGTAIPAVEQHAVCGSGCEYTTIQAAVNGEAAGSTILVKNGTYNESVTVNKSLTLQAESTAARVVGGPAYNQGAFNITANNVKIDGFTIGDASTMIGTVGIDLGSTSGATVSNNIIEHNQRGVSLNGASNATLSGNTIRDNNANPENNAGIWGDNVTGITISSSAFSGASNTSINLAGSSNVTLSGNTFTSGDNAAVLWGDSNVTLANNTASGLGSSGFFITGTDGLTASGNNLSAPTAAGKSAFSVSTASGQTSSNITLTKNSLSGYMNGVNVASGAASDQVQAAQNWFGAANGPSDNTTTDSSKPAANPTGTGSAVNGNVDYANWCTNATCTTFSNDVPTNQTIVVRPGSLNGWSSADTTGGGVINFVADSTSPLPNGTLQLTTTATNQSKANLAKADSFRLDQLRQLNYSTKQLGASAADGDASLQLAVMLDGTTGYTNLVYEPYWNGTVQANQWQDWDAFTGKFWSSRSYGSIQAGAGGAPFYTIDDILRAYPNAQVVGYDLNVGTYNPSYTIDTDAFHMATTGANTTYNFEQDLDTTKPTVTLTTPADSAWNPSTISVDAHDNVGLTQVTANIYSGSTIKKSCSANPAGTMDYTLNCPVPGTLADGAYTIKYNAKDTSGNFSATKTSTFRIDHTPAVVTISSPATGQKVSTRISNNTLTVTGTFTDTSSGANYAQLQLVDAGGNSRGLVTKHGAADSNSTLAQFDMSGLPDGNYRVYYVATDVAGNVSTRDYVEFTLDNTRPTATLTAPTAGSYNPSTMTVEASDSEGLSKVTANIYDQSNTSLIKSCSGNASGAMSYTLNCPVPSTLGDETYTIRYNSQDVAGNISATGTQQFTIDTLVQTVSITSASQTSKNTVSFSGDVSDPSLKYYYCYLTTNQTITVSGHTYTAGQEVGTRDARCQTKWANGQTTFTGELGSFDVTHLPSGSYTANLVAYDKAGNNNAANPATSTVAIDHTAPVVTINQPAAIHSGDPITFTGTVQDTFGTLTVAFNGKSYQLTSADVTSNNWTLRVPSSDTAGLTAGHNYPVTVSATDAAGNQSTDTSASQTTLTVQSSRTTSVAGNSDNHSSQDQGTGDGSGFAAANNRNALAALLATNDTAAIDPTPPTVTDTQGNVLGTSDNKSGTATHNDDQGQVKGAATTTWNIFGFAWYWWLLLLAVILGLIWWIAAARRRRNEA